MFDSDRQHFESLAIQHMDTVYSQAIRLLRNAKNAEDLAQRTFESAYRRFEKFDKRSDFKKWLIEILMLIYANTHLQGPLVGDRKVQNAHFTFVQTGIPKKYVKKDKR